MNITVDRLMTLCNDKNFCKVCIWGIESDDVLFMGFYIDCPLELRGEYVESFDPISDETECFVINVDL